MYHGENLGHVRLDARCKIISRNHPFCINYTIAYGVEIPKYFVVYIFFL